MKKVLIGCAVLLAIVMVGLVAAGVAGYMWVRDNAGDFQAVADERRALDEAHGTAEAFVPPPSIVEPERVKVFVALRESLAVSDDAAVESIGIFLPGTGGTGSGGIGGFIRMARGGMSAYGAVLDYVSDRTRLLSNHGMGEGEYAFLYTLTGFVWLGLDPIDIVDRAGGDDDALEGIEEITDEYRRLFVRQLRNLPADTADDRVEAALDAARASRAFPFAGSVPEDWAVVLEPYRGRLEYTLPSIPGEVIVEGLSTFIESEGDGFQFQFGTRD